MHSGPPRSDPADIDSIKGGSDDKADQGTCERGLDAAGRGGRWKLATHTHASVFFCYYF